MTTAAERRKQKEADKRAALKKKLAEAEAQVSASSSGASLYIGVDTGSSLEQKGFQASPTGGPRGPGSSFIPSSYKDSPQYKKPLYKTGYLSSEKFSAELDHMDRKSVYNLQQMLDATGQLKNYVPGEMDAPTRAAMKGLLATANQTGSTWQETLDRMVETGGVAEDPKAGRAPLTTELTSPIDIESVARKAAGALYAGAMTPEELNSFIDSYQSQEAGYQQQAYGMGETGGTLTQPPSVSAAAEKFLRDNHGDQVNASQFGDTLDTYLRLIKSGG